MRARTGTYVCGGRRRLRDLYRSKFTPATTAAAAAGEGCGDFDETYVGPCMRLKARQSTNNVEMLSATEDIPHRVPLIHLL